MLRTRTGMFGRAPTLRPRAWPHLAMAPACAASTRCHVRTPPPRKSLPEGTPLALNTLAPVERRKPRKRVGRGRGGGMGKTATRGYNGAKSKSGYSLQAGFEGGQMPLKRRFPKYGAWSNALFRLDYQTVSIGRLLSFVDRGVLDASQPITMKHMHDAGVLKVSYPGVKLLSDGAEWLERKPMPLQFEVSRASANAKAAVEAAGA
jgi:large subunit ribosomal protein L15